MLTVTTGALGRLSSKLTCRNAGEEMALRFTRALGGWRLSLDSVCPADKTFSHEGRKVLLLDSTASKAMRNMTLDVRSTRKGPRLSLRRDSDNRT
jgi:hypothetical protein